ncbi:ABC transporter ATP-binding protein [soil metagenome]
MSSVELLGVTKSWDSSTALSGIDVRIPSGTFCVLLGPSGCGKSTTLRIIAGLETASTGEVLIDGRNVTDLPPARRGVGMVFQNYALFPHLTVAENIVFGLRVRKVPQAERLERCRRAATLLGLTELLDRRPSQLSGGQQQRVALGRALVAQAKVCLMDEPLSNLDAQLRQDMRRELRDLQQELGLTVIYVTHDQAEAMSMADQVVLLNRGRIEQAGTPRQLYGTPATTFAAKFIGTPPMNLVKLDAGRIAGSVFDTGIDAPTLGIRPEQIALGDSGIEAVVASLEYLGADLVLRCLVGTELLMVRATGQHTATPGDHVRLHWAPEHAHGFDGDGRRITSHATHREESPCNAEVSLAHSRAA